MDGGEAIKGEFPRPRQVVEIGARVVAAREAGTRFFYGAGIIVEMRVP